MSKKTWTKKTWTKCLLSLSSFLISFVKELEGRIGEKSCKHEQMAPTRTNYEHIAVTLCLMSIAILRRRLRDCARVRRRATRSWLLRRKQRSAYNTLLKELHTVDPNEFRNYFRMDKSTFKMLLEKVRPLIERQDTKLREAISAAERLAVTLRFLATDFPFPPFYYHVLLFCKHHLIIPKQYSDWLISVKVYQSLKKNRMEFYSIKVGQSF